MLSESWRRATACLVAASVTSFLVVGTVSAEPGTVFSGKVFGAEGSTPREGVVVRLVGETPDSSYSTDPTGADGAFRLEGAPPGSYRVLAEAREGAYLAADGFQLQPGANQPVALTLGDASPNQQTADQTSTTGGTSTKQGLPTWAKWTIVGGIAVIALWAIDSVTDDDEELPASPM